jgi:ABC-type Fe3+-hydroxamate transport system substrate-binding protein
VITVEDDVGREVKLPHAARRIVSLVPSLTEALFGLGRGDAVVGVTRYCTEPGDAVRRLDKVGGTKNPDIARVCALHPDLVILNAEENRREDFEALERAGLNVFVSFPLRVRDVSGLFRKLGELTGSRTAAKREAARLEHTLTEIKRRQAPQLRVFCPIWKNPWMSFDQDTYASDMLSIAGGWNVCGAQAQRYCTVTLDAIAATLPEVILLPDEPYRFTSRVLPDLELLRETPACKTNRVHFIDGKALSWYGPRTAPAIPYLQSFLTA